MLLIEKTGLRSPIRSKGLRWPVCIPKDLASACVLCPNYSWCPISGRRNKRKFREGKKQQRLEVEIEQSWFSSWRATYIGTECYKLLSSLTCTGHAFYFSLSFMIYMRHPQGWHAFIHETTSLLPYVLHVFASRWTPVLYLFKTSS